MRAIQVQKHGGVEQLRLVDIPKPTPAPGEALVHITAAAINPLDATVRLGLFPGSKQPPLVLGNEGVGVIEEPGDSGLPKGQRVIVCMGAKGYGVYENGTWAEYVVADPKGLIPVPEGVTDPEAAGPIVAYLTGQLALAAGGFKAGQTVLAPGVGGAVGNAVVQIARAQGARVLTSAGSSHKAEQAKAAGYSDVIDLSTESLDAGVGRLTDGQGADIAIDSIGGTITGPSLASLKHGGVLIVLGYPAGSKAIIDVTDLIWKTSRIVGFNLFTVAPELIGPAVGTILSLLTEKKIRPLVARTFPLEQAAEAQRYQTEDRPFGKVVLTV